MFSQIPQQASNTFTNYDPLQTQFMTGGMEYAPNSQFMTSANYGAFRSMPAMDTSLPGQQKRSMWQSYLQSRQGDILGLGKQTIDTYNPFKNQTHQQLMAQRDYSDQMGGLGRGIGSTILQGSKIAAGIFGGPIGMALALGTPDPFTALSKRNAEARQYQNSSMAKMVAGPDMAAGLGKGLSKEAATRMVADMRMQVADDETFKHEDYQLINKISMQTGMQDFSGSAKQFSDVNKKMIKNFAFLAKAYEETDFNELGKIVQRMQRMGGDVDSHQRISNQENMFSRATGIKHQELTNTYGQQGAMMYTQAGMTGYQGSLANISNAAMVTMMQRTGGLTAAELSRAGGTSGMSQRITEGKIAVNKNMEEYRLAYAMKEDGSGLDEAKVKELMKGVSLETLTNVAAEKMKDPALYKQMLEKKQEFTHDMREQAGTTGMNMMNLNAAIDMAKKTKTDKSAPITKSDIMTGLMLMNGGDANSARDMMRSFTDRKGIAAMRDQEEQQRREVIHNEETRLSKRNRFLTKLQRGFSKGVAAFGEGTVGAWSAKNAREEDRLENKKVGIHVVDTDKTVGSGVYYGDEVVKDKEGKVIMDDFVATEGRYTKEELEIKGLTVEKDGVGKFGSDGKIAVKTFKDRYAAKKLETSKKLEKTFGDATKKIKKQLRADKVRSLDTSAKYEKMITGATVETDTLRIGYKYDTLLEDAKTPEAKVALQKAKQEELFVAQGVTESGKKEASVFYKKRQADQVKLEKLKKTDPKAAKALASKMEEDETKYYHDREDKLSAANIDVTKTDEERVTEEYDKKIRIAQKPEEVRKLRDEQLKKLKKAKTQEERDAISEEYFDKKDALLKSDAVKALQSDKRVAVAVARESTSEGKLAAKTFFTVQEDKRKKLVEMETTDPMGANTREWKFNADIREFNKGRDIRNKTGAKTKARALMESETYIATVGEDDRDAARTLTEKMAKPKAQLKALEASRQRIDERITAAENSGSNSYELDDLKRRRNSLGSRIRSAKININNMKSDGEGDFKANEKTAKELAGAVKKAKDENELYVMQKGGMVDRRELIGKKSKDVEDKKNRDIQKVKQDKTLGEEEKAKKIAEIEETAKTTMADYIEKVDDETGDLQEYKYIVEADKLKEKEKKKRAVEAAFEIEETKKMTEEEKDRGFASAEALGLDGMELQSVFKNIDYENLSDDEKAQAIYKAASASHRLGGSKEGKETASVEEIRVALSTDKDLSNLINTRIKEGGHEDYEALVKEHGGSDYEEQAGTADALQDRINTLTDNMGELSEQSAVWRLDDDDQTDAIIEGFKKDKNTGSYIMANAAMMRLEDSASGGTAAATAMKKPAQAMLKKHLRKLGKSDEYIEKVMSGRISRKEVMAEFSSNEGYDEENYEKTARSYTKGIGTKLEYHDAKIENVIKEMGEIQEAKGRMVLRNKVSALAGAENVDKFYNDKKYRDKLVSKMESGADKDFMKSLVEYENEDGQIHRKHAVRDKLSKGELDTDDLTVDKTKIVKTEGLSEKTVEIIKKSDESISNLNSMLATLETTMGTGMVNAMDKQTKASVATLNYLKSKE